MGAGVVALALVAVGVIGCAASPVVKPNTSASPTRANDASAYEMQLGEVEPGTTARTVKTSIYVPAVAAGVWLRMSELDATSTSEVCQLTVTDTVQSSSDQCSVEVFERDDHGRLQGIVLHIDGLDEAGYFETDVRDLRRTEDGGWSGETGMRSVKLWGFLLLPKGEPK